MSTNTKVYRFAIHEAIVHRHDRRMMSKSCFVEHAFYTSLKAERHLPCSGQQSDHHCNLSREERQHFSQVGTEKKGKKYLLQVTHKNF